MDGKLENCLQVVWTVAWYSFKGSGEREGITGFKLITGTSVLKCLGEGVLVSLDSTITGQEGVEECGGI